MNVAQAMPIEKLDEQGFFHKGHKLPEAFTNKNGKDLLGITETSREKSGSVDSRPVGVMTQTTMLFVREIKNIARDKTIMGGRIGFSIILSALIGTIFYDVGDQPLDVSTNLTSHFGALIMILVLGMMGTAQHIGE